MVAEHDAVAADEELAALVQRHHVTARVDDLGLDVRQHGAHSRGPFYERCVQRRLEGDRTVLGRTVQRLELPSVFSLFTPDVNYTLELLKTYRNSATRSYALETSLMKYCNL